MNRRAVSALIVSVLGLALFGPESPQLDACNVPVFRYALERWKSEPYELFLFHRGSLTPENQAIADALRQYLEGAASTTNATLAFVDLTKEANEALVREFESQFRPELPWLMVRYPARAKIKQPAWTGRLRDAALATLLDSPVRCELTKRLSSGESAVWLFVESGDKDQDDAAHALLERELARLEKSLKLREQAGDAGDELGKSGPPLRVAFSTLRVSRSNLEERVLLALLLHCEADLAGTREPMVFPVFGRGLTLLPLIGKGIHPDVIERTAGALVSYCEDTFRQQQPFVDLLVTADWDAIIQGRQVRDPALPSLTGLVAPEPIACCGVVPEPTWWESLALLPEDPIVRNSLLGLAAGLVVFGVGARIWMSKRKA
jgi:hypothetical protein